MTKFLGTHQNKLDAKGRVSIPAQFRTVLKTEGSTGAGALVLRRSHNHPCIEGWPFEVFEKLATPFERLDLFSAEQDDFAATLFADAMHMETDKEGRIVLPADLIEHAGLTDSVTFMGVGPRFEIWEPAAAEERRRAARERARERTMTLPGMAP